MYCLYCGQLQKEGDKICPNCGHPLEYVEPETPTGPLPQVAPQAAQATQAAQAAPAAPAAQATQDRPQQKSKGKLKGILIALVLLVIVAFSLIAFGILPRFWDNGSASNDADPHAQYIDEQNGVELEDLAGLSPEQAKNKLEEQGFKVGDTVERYSFAGDNNKKVAYTEPAAGSKLADGAPVDLVVVKGIDLLEARSWVIDKLKLSSQLEENPDLLTGELTAEYRADEDSSVRYHSYCDAATKTPGTPTIAIKNVNMVALNADVTKFENFAIHHHSNESSPRHYNAKDDSFSTLSDLTDATSLVMSVREDDSLDGDCLTWESQYELDTGEKNNSGKAVTVKYYIGLNLHVATNVSLNEPATIGKLLGDNVTDLYETEEEAYEALADALWEECWYELSVYQGYNRTNADRVEHYVLTLP